MKPKVMKGFFGYAFHDTIFIRADLPQRVRSFVLSHEKYHLMDKRKWWGWVGAELRANLSCGFRDPIGLLATVSASITRSRLKTYLRLLKTSGRTEA